MKQRFSKRTRLVSALLTLAMVFTFLPFSAFAANTEIDFNSPDFKLNFPDEEFRRFLKECCDKNGDGKLDVDIKNMTIPTSYAIKSLEGIRFFEDLEKLDCHGIGLTTLNVGKNFKLRELDCSYNQLKDYLYINNRIVCFDIKQLGKQLKKLGMLIVQDAVWGRVTANRSAGKSTRYYADEFHLLLKEEQTAAYSVEIWKRFRKWGGIPTALTQNVKDLLASPEVSNIFENSDFVYMLNQANGDRQILAKQLNISPHQLSYVTHSGEGEGLLFFGNVILPFVDHFPKDLELYRILTTRLSEVAEAQKHE